MLNKKMFWPLLTSVCLMNISVVVACEVPSINSGISGKVFISPVCPVVRVGENCAERPYKANFVVVNDRGSIVEHINSDEAGNFSVMLAPGVYTLKPTKETNILPFLKDQPPVTVVPNQITPVTLHFDSGLR